MPSKECQVFGDRLTDNQDSKWMTSQIKRNLAEEVHHEVFMIFVTNFELGITLFGRCDRPFGRQLRCPIRVMSQVEGVVRRFDKTN